MNQAEMDRINKQNLKAIAKDQTITFRQANKLVMIGTGFPQTDVTGWNSLPNKVSGRIKKGAKHLYCRSNAGEGRGQFEAAMERITKKEVVWEN